MRSDASSTGSDAFPGVPPGLVLGYSGFLIHAAFVLHVPLATATAEDLRDLLRFAQHLSKELKKVEWHLLGAALATITAIWALPLPLQVTLLVISLSLLAYILCKDEALVQGYVGSARELVPCEEMVEQVVVTHFLPLFIMCHNFSSMMQHADPKRLADWFDAGLFLALAVYAGMVAALHQPLQQLRAWGHAGARLCCRLHPQPVQRRLGLNRFAKKLVGDFSSFPYQGPSGFLSISFWMNIGLASVLLREPPCCVTPERIQTLGA